jgi:hypothetical protein
MPSPSDPNLPDSNSNFEAVCDDVHINLRLAVKMDLPQDRETVLGLFDRVRKDFPDMSRFRKMKRELLLEGSPAPDAGPDDQQGDDDDAAPAQRWLAIRQRDLRCGVMNPVTTGEAYKLHKTILETAPYYLSLSPLDVDYVELMYGFDLFASGNHDALVYDALFAHSPIGAMLDVRGSMPLDCQPLFVISVTEDLSISAQFEVKTRLHAPMPGHPRPPRDHAEPISIFLCLRKHGGVKDIAELPGVLQKLSRHAEDLIARKLVPNAIVPIRQAIASAGG